MEGGSLKYVGEILGVWGRKRGKSWEFRAVDAGDPGGGILRILRGRCWGEFGEQILGGTGGKSWGVEGQGKGQILGI